MDVVLNARREDRLHDAAEAVRQRGRRAEIVPGDVTDEGISEEMLSKAYDTFGRCDAVFANAGYGAETPVVCMSDESVRRMFEVNFFASLELVRLAVLRWRESESPGHALMCSSCVAKFTLPCYGVYSATKASQNLVCRAMNSEMRPFGIHVSSVHPVTTRTEFFEVSAREAGLRHVSGSVPDHAPSMFVQPHQRVARGIVKCLRRPTPEVWTSWSVRMAAALLTAFPRSTDLLLRRIRSDGLDQLKSS